MNFLQTYRRQAPATSILILVMAVIWVMTAVQSQSITNNAIDSSVGEYLILRPFALTPVSVVGSMFLHLSISHLAANSFVLGLVGREIELGVNRAVYVGCFFAGGLAAAAVVVHMDYFSATAGASGAIYALMVLLIAQAYRRRSDLRAPFIFLGINVVFSFITPGVSVWGHLGGIIGGACLIPAVISSRPAVQWAAIGVCSVLAIAALVL